VQAHGCVGLHFCRWAFQGYCIFKSGVAIFLGTLWRIVGWVSTPTLQVAKKKGLVIFTGWKSTLRRQRSFVDDGMAGFRLLELKLRRAGKPEIGDCHADTN
jgi:hypothetical protein